MFNHQFPMVSPSSSMAFQKPWAKLQIAQGHQASQEMHLAPGDQIVPGAFSWTIWVDWWGK
jgi:hypothetical protein